MNLKKIVSVMTAASMMAAMAVNASAFTYSTNEEVADNKVTTTLTWKFADAGQGPSLADAALNGLSFEKTKGTALDVSSSIGTQIKADDSGSDVGAIQLQKAYAAIVYTPSTDGTLTIETNKVNNNAEVRVGTEYDKTDTNYYTVGSTTTTVSLEKGTKYYIYNSTSATVKVKSLSFTSSVDGTANFSADVKNKGAITKAADTSDNKVGTAFVATIKNEGTASGTISSINWTVTSSKGDTKSTGDLTDGLTKLTLGIGSTADVALYVEGLGDKRATATAAVK